MLLFGGWCLKCIQFFEPGSCFTWLSITFNTCVPNFSAIATDQLVDLFRESLYKSMHMVVFRSGSHPGSAMPMHALGVHIHWLTLCQWRMYGKFGTLTMMPLFVESWLMWCDWWESLVSSGPAGLIQSRLRLVWLIKLLLGTGVSNSNCRRKATPWCSFGFVKSLIHQKVSVWQRELNILSDFLTIHCPRGCWQVEFLARCVPNIHDLFLPWRKPSKPCRFLPSWLLLVNALLMWLTDVYSPYLLG